MKNLIKLAASVAIVGTMFLSTTIAQTPYLNHRQHEQQVRIAQGIRSGELTPFEVARIERQESAIQHQKLVEERYGRLTKCERTQINRELNRTNREIYRDKHNRWETSYAR